MAATTVHGTPFSIAVQYEPPSVSVVMATPHNTYDLVTLRFKRVCEGVSALDLLSTAREQLNIRGVTLPDKILQASLDAMLKRTELVLPPQRPSVATGTSSTAGQRPSAALEQSEGDDGVFGSMNADEISYGGEEADQLDTDGYF